LLHREPFFGNFKIELCIDQSALFETFPKIGGTLGPDVVKHSLRDETAAVTLAGHSVKNLQSCIWKDDINALAHVLIVHTFRV
jgi:hypothetical protein